MFVIVKSIEKTQHSVCWQVTTMTSHPVTCCSALEMLLSKIFRNLKSALKQFR